MFLGHQIKVSLRDTAGTLVGCAVLDKADYCTLIESPAIKADTVLWTLNDAGEVTTRVRGNGGAFEVCKVSDLLLGIRSESRVTIDRQAVA